MEMAMANKSKPITYCEEHAMWHAHHSWVLPLEVINEPIEDRLRTIRGDKVKAGETPGQTGRRVQLLKPFTGEVPRELLELERSSRYDGVTNSTMFEPERL